MNDTHVVSTAEMWRVRWEEAQTDAQWVEQQRLYDAQRVAVRQAIQDHLQDFISGRISLEPFRATFDLRTRKEWSVFGMKGMSGAMVLNMLVKHLPDHARVTAELKAVLSAPSNEDEARDKLGGFLAFLHQAIGPESPKQTKSLPKLTPCFVSGWWHMQAPEQWPIYYVSARNALSEDGLFANTTDLIGDYLAFRAVFLELMQRLGLSAWSLEHLFVRHIEKRPVSTPPPVEPPPPPDPPGADGTSHTRVQWQLAKMGRKLGCKVWIAANDRCKEFNGDKLADLSIPELPGLGLDKESQDLIRLIDVLWIKGTNQVAAAFEIECTTSVYSGLLRLSDLTALSPNLSFPLYIVAPQVRLEKVRRELSRPTFQYLEMDTRCGFFSEESLFSNAENIMKWAADPSAIEKLAIKVGDEKEE